MKQLFIVRHAKTEWAGGGKSDFSRSLTPTGINEAKYMAKLLTEIGIKIDLMLCSSALRARETASLFSGIIEQKKIKLIYVDELYLAPLHILNHLIDKLSNNFNSVMIIGHNPGLTDWANSMNEQVRIDELPTCGIYAVESNALNWSDFEKSAKKFLFFESPIPHQSNFSK